MEPATPSPTPSGRLPLKCLLTANCTGNMYEYGRPNRQGTVRPVFRCHKCRKSRATIPSTPGTRTSTPAKESESTTPRSTSETPDLEGKSSSDGEDSIPVARLSAGAAPMSRGKAQKKKKATRSPSEESRDSPATPAPVKRQRVSASPPVQPEKSKEEEKQVEKPTEKFPDLGFPYERKQKIEAQDENGNWFKAIIVDVEESSGKVLVHFEGWNSRFDEWVFAAVGRLRPRSVLQAGDRTRGKFEVGDFVFARWKSISYPAKVQEIEPNGRVLVLYYDGFEKSLKTREVRRMPPEEIEKIENKEEFGKELKLLPEYPNPLFDPELDRSLNLSRKKRKSDLPQNSPSGSGVGVKKARKRKPSLALSPVVPEKLRKEDSMTLELEPELEEVVAEKKLEKEPEVLEPEEEEEESEGEKEEVQEPEPPVAPEKEVSEEPTELVEEAEKSGKEEEETYEEEEETEEQKDDKPVEEEEPAEMVEEKEESVPPQDDTEKVADVPNEPEEGEATKEQEEEEEEAVPEESADVPKEEEKAEELLPIPLSDQCFPGITLEEEEEEDEEEEEEEVEEEKKQEVEEEEKSTSSEEAMPGEDDRDPDYNEEEDKQSDEEEEEESDSAELALPLSAFAPSPEKKKKLPDVCEDCGERPRVFRIGKDTRFGCRCAANEEQKMTTPPSSGGGGTGPNWYHNSSFKEEWMKGREDWLRFEDGKMWCSVCFQHYPEQSHGFILGITKGFTMCRLTSHEQSRDHQIAAKTQRKTTAKEVPKKKEEEKKTPVPVVVEKEKKEEDLEEEKQKRDKKVKEWLPGREHWLVVDKDNQMAHCKVCRHYSHESEKKTNWMTGQSVQRINSSVQHELSVVHIKNLKRYYSEIDEPLPEELMPIVEKSKEPTIWEQKKEYPCTHEGCTKAFRSENQLGAHIRHYHQKQQETPPVPAPAPAPEAPPAPAESVLPPIKPLVIRNLSKLQTNPPPPISEDSSEVTGSDSGSESESEERETEEELVERLEAGGSAADEKEEEKKHKSPMDLVRCICRDNEDNGFMIQCDRCYTWQHGDCFKIFKGAEPADYICYICKHPPRQRKSAKWTSSNWQLWREQGRTRTMKQFLRPRPERPTPPPDLVTTRAAAALHAIRLHQHAIALEERLANLRPRIRSSERGEESEEQQQELDEQQTALEKELDLMELQLTAVEREWCRSELEPEVAARNFTQSLGKLKKMAQLLQ